MVCVYWTQEGSSGFKLNFSSLHPLIHTENEGKAIRSLPNFEEIIAEKYYSASINNNAEWNKLLSLMELFIASNINQCNHCKLD